MRAPKLSLFEYQALVEKAPILIWRAGVDARCDYFNESWLTFRGRTMEQEYGNGWVDGVHPDDLNNCLSVYLENFERRLIFDMEYRLMRHDGVYRWISDRGVPFNDPGGNFAGYIGSCMDITERIEAQEKLRRRLEAEIHVLKGVIPICSCCKKIRDDKESWQQLEKYITEHSEALFSHGLCPECYEKEMAKIKDLSNARKST
jgi:two-component system CheB/CheR fusion protein